MGSKVGTVMIALLAGAAPVAARADAPAVGPDGDAVPTQGQGSGQSDGESLRERVHAPPRLHGATVARVMAPSFARVRPRSRRRGWRVSAGTAWSVQPQTLLVLDAASRDRRDWVKVLLPVRPNGSAGWLPRDRLALGRTRYWIDVDTGARLVTVYRGGRRVRRFRAVVGAPGTPTPLGLAAIYERNRQPNPSGFLGPWALPLTSFSRVLMNYDGGPGRIGIHGRAGASLRDPLGSARSAGCIRIDNHHVSWMAAHVPRGTPVRIT